MITSPPGPDDRLSAILPHLQQVVRDHAPRIVKGRVRRLLGVIVHATITDVRVGEICHLVDPVTKCAVMAEVIGLVDDMAVLTPVGDLTGLSSRTEVIPTGAELRVPVGEGLLGRVINALGEPLDGTRWTASQIDAFYPIGAQPPSPLARRLITDPIQLGIRSIDGLLTCARGQRVGHFRRARDR
jgi:type III secretion protein N (ATPase)